MVGTSPESPPEVRPSFCPSSSFKSAFTLISEEALVAIIWDRDSVGRIMERVCSRGEAVDMAKNRYGELFHKLFVGNADNILSNPNKKQTCYGRTTTTMNRISSSTPQTHGHDPLRSYLLRLYGYYRDKKD